MSKLFQNYQKNQQNQTLLNPKLKDVSFSPNQETFLKSPNPFYDSDWIIPDSNFNSQKTCFVMSRTPVKNQKIYFTLHYYFSQTFNISEQYLPFIKSNIMINKVPNIDIGNFNILIRNAYLTDWYKIYGGSILLNEGLFDDVEYTELEPGHSVQLDWQGILYLLTYYTIYETPRYNTLRVQRDVPPLPISTLPYDIHTEIFQNNYYQYAPSTNEIWTKQTDNLFRYECFGDISLSGNSTVELSISNYNTIDETYSLVPYPPFQKYYTRDSENRPITYVPVYTPDVTNLKIRLLLMFNNPKLDLINKNYTVK